MPTLKPHTTLAPAALAHRLFRLERSGRYKEGLEELFDIWPDFDSLPQIVGLEPKDAAEILLRCGSLIGFHGHNIQKQNAQELSRDLIMKARDYFSNCPDLEKVVECENYLALSYWRTGELPEAQIWIDESFSRTLLDSSETRLFSYIIQCLIWGSGKKNKQSLAALKSVETAFLACKDDCLKGDFFNHCGLALDNLGQKSDALVHFESAKFYHRRSRHRIYLGTIENNLAWLYKGIGNFDRAHESIDNATRLFKQVKDSTREGFSLDTKASLLFAERKFSEALVIVERAILLLRKGNNFGYLVETLLNKSKILLSLDNFSEAIMSLLEAVNIARLQMGDDAAKRLIGDFEVALLANGNPKVELEMTMEAGKFELVLPQSIDGFTEYRGIRINSSKLDKIGLTKGSLAVVAKTEIKRGDLIAVRETKTDDVSCGFYDADFGLVCLDSGDNDPQIFNEKDIIVLGKIVGICPDNSEKGGRLKVEALNL